MRCSHAMDLMSQEIDGLISDADATLLHLHVSNCRACASYYDRLSQSISMVNDHSATISEDALNKDLDVLVQNALSSERITHSQLNNASDVLRFTNSLRLPALRLILKTAAVAVMLMLVSYAAVDRITDVGDYSTETCNLGHIESFSVKTDPQGRVYAVITDRNSIGTNAGGSVK